MNITARDLPFLARVLIRTYGWRGIGRRAAYEFSHRSGQLARALPAEDRCALAGHDWSWPLRFDLDRIRREYGCLKDFDAIREEVVADAERVLAGEMRFYGWAWRRVEWPPRWHVNPWTGHKYRPEHWTQISDFAPENGDIKDVWEMSRLPFTYLFTRAWVLTGEDRYPEAWWRAIEDWAEHNPPNRGVNWKCGQETSIRGIALQFGLTAFGDHPSATSQRMRIAGGLLQASVRRVLPTLRYALSQRNNHAISESVFLQTMAIAGDDRQQVGWVSAQALKEAISDQFYPDGWYAQHSFNYQRLAIHTLMWLNSVRGAAGLAAEPLATSAIARSTNLLREAQDPVSGWLPNLGPDDGALLFPLTTCDHRDFRPVLATHRESGGPDWGDRYDEETIWLGRLSPDRTQPSIRPRSIVTLRGTSTHVIVRSGVPRHRLNHDDLLHIDLWVNGENVLADPGTYRYTAPPPWMNPFTARRVHNVPYAEGGNDRRIGRFLTIAWPTATVVRHNATGDGAEVVRIQSRDGTSVRLRTIVRRDDRYAVIDHDRGHPFAVRWTFGGPFPAIDAVWGTEVRSTTCRVRVYGDTERLGTDDSDPSTAWISPHYGARLPTTALVAHSDRSALVVTFAPLNADPLSVDLHRMPDGESDAADWVRWSASF